MGTTGLRAEFQVEIHSSFSFSMGFGKSLWHRGAFRRAPWGVRGAQRGVCGVTGRGQGWVAVGETLPPLGGTSAAWPGPAPSPRTAAGDLGTVPWGMLWDGAQRTGSCSLALSTPLKLIYSGFLEETLLYHKKHQLAWMILSALWRFYSLKSFLYCSSPEPAGLFTYF